MAKKIELKDIEFHIGGFYCKKIKKLTDKQLLELEEKISKLGKTVAWVESEEFGFLSVSLWKSSILDSEYKLKVCEILNSI